MGLMDLNVSGAFKIPLVVFPIAFLLALGTNQCGATDKEPCTQADLGKVVAAHEARLAEKCVGQGKDCPNRKAEDARFKEEVRKWVRCDEVTP
jgi:hypothetical protein